MEQIRGFENEQKEKNQQIERLEAENERNQSELTKYREDMIAINGLNERLEADNEGTKKELDRFRVLHQEVNSQYEEAEAEMVRIRQEMEQKQKGFDDEVQRLKKENEELIIRHQTEKERESEKIRQSESALDV